MKKLNTLMQISICSSIIMLGSCTSDAPQVASGKSCIDNGTQVAIYFTVPGTHTGGLSTHNFTIAKADIIAGADKTYQIMGDADHNHVATITAAQFDSLRNNHPITSYSSSVIGHAVHKVQVTCK